MSAVAAAPADASNSDSISRAGTPEVDDGAEVVESLDEVAESAVSASPTSAGPPFSDFGAESAPPWVPRQIDGDGGSDQGSPVERTELIPIAPARMLETRSENSTVDGDFQLDARLQFKSVTRLQVAGRGGVDRSASAAVVNITAIRPDAQGYITVYPCGERPLTSSLNYLGGDVVGNEIIAKLSSAGELCIYTQSATDLVVDATGYAPSGLAYRAVQPARLVDTRTGETTSDGLSQGAGRIGAGETLRFGVRGRGGVPATAVESATVNVTAVAPAASGFLTVFDCGERPLASSLNFVGGDVRGNEVIGRLSEDGDLCVFSSVATHLVVDVAGYTPINSAYQSLVPSRLVETRVGNSTIDGQISLSESLSEQRRIRPGEIVEVQIGGRAGIPDENVVAAVMNVTAIKPSSNGFLTIYSCDDEQPIASGLNFAAGDVVGNEVLAGLSTDGRLCVFSSADTDLVVDVVGYVPDWAAPIPLFDEGWRLEPSTVMFTSDDQSSTVRLVHYGSDGRPDGLAVPAGVELIRDDSSTVAYDVEFDVARGRVEVAGAERIGAEVLAISIPGLSDTLPLWVTSTRVADGVVVLGGDQVLLPPPEGAEVDATGPFTTSELLARGVIDASTGLFRLPYVLSGDVPPTGTIIVAGGSNDALGRIVEPEGLPTIVRDGLTLVSLELVPVFDVFTAIDVDVDLESLQDAGVFSPVTETLCFGVDDPDCDQTVLATPTGVTRTIGPESLAEPRASASGDNCEVDAGLAGGETKFKGAFNLTPLGGFKVNGGSVLAGQGGSDELRVIEITAGLRVEPQVGIDGKILATLGASLTCTLLDLKPRTIYLPAPLTPFFAIAVNPSIELDLPIEASAGPGVKYGASISAFAEKVFGVRWIEGRFIAVNRSKPSRLNPPEGSIEPVTGFTPGLGPVIEAEFKPAILLAMEAGIALGGPTVEWFGRLLGRNDFGRFLPFEAKAGPRLDFGWANTASVVKEAATPTKVEARLVATAGLNDVEIESVFGFLIGDGVSIELPSLEFGFTLPKPLIAPLVASPAQVKVDGDVVEKVEVDKNAEVVIEIKDTADPFFTSRLGDPIEMYEKKDDGFVLSEDLLWSASTTKVTGKTKITTELCEKYGVKGKTFVVVARASAVGGAFQYPTYLGEFKLACDRGMEWTEEEITLTLDEPKQKVTLKQKGLDEEIWTLAPQLDTTQGAVAKPTPETARWVEDSVPGQSSKDEVEIEFELDCKSAESNKYDQRILASAGDSTATLKVVLDCTRTLEVAPDPLGLSKRDATKSISVTQDGLDEADWEIALKNGPLPSGFGLSFSASSGTFAAEKVDIEVTLSCSGDADSVKTFMYEIETADPLETQSFSIEANCTDSYLDIPGESTLEVVGGASVSIDTQGDDDTAWAPVGRMEADNSSPTPGFLPGRDSTSEQAAVLTAVTQADNRKQQPISLPCHSDGLEALPESKAPGGVSAPGRGSDTIIVVWPEREGRDPEPLDPCPPPPPPDPPPPPGGSDGPGNGGNGGPGSGGGGTSTGRSTGDPHVGSFDGLGYDAQTVGEYIYAEPIDPESDGPRLTIRHKPTRQVVTPFAPTSVLGVAVEQYGVKFEVVQSPFAVFVNGTAASFPPGSYIELVPGLFVGQPTSGVHRFTTNEIDVTVQGLASQGGFSYLNLEVTAPSDGALVGMLGIPDGDTSNDLLVRDPSLPIADWDSITVGEARDHKQELFDFTDSWRLTDPADSPFTLADPIFDQPNTPRPGTEILAPFREQAEQLLAGNAAFCVEAGASSSYAIDVFAIELAIGNELELLTCEFELTGSVRTDDPDAIAVGMEVSVSAPGLTSCTTTTDTVGNWRCRVGPDPEQAAPSDVVFPYDVAVDVRVVGDETVVASGPGVLDGRAPFNGVRKESRLDPIVVGADAAAVIELSGALSTGDVPISKVTSLSLIGRDAAGVVVVRTRLNVEPDGDGRYSELIALPRRVTTLAVEWRVGVNGDHEVADFDTIVPGLNSLDFTRNYHPARLDLSGELRLNGEPSRGVIDVTAHREDGSSYTLRLPITSGADGRYAAQTYVATDVVSIDIFGTTGNPANATAVVSVDTLVPGPNSIPLDVVIDAPRLIVEGDASLNGVVPSGMHLRVEGAGFGRLVSLVYPAGDGTFTEVFDLPSGVTDATVTALVGTIAADYPELVVDDLVDGDNTVAFDANLETPVLALSGRVEGGGVGFFGSTRLVISDPNSTESISVFVGNNASGDYSVSVPLPVGVTDVDVTAVVGFDTPDRPSTSFSNLVSGENARDFDVEFDAVGIAFSGILEIDGVGSVGTRSLTIALFDENDQLLSRTSRGVQVAADGSYSLGYVGDPAGVRAEVTALLGPWRTHRMPLAIADVTARPTTVDYSVNAITHRLAVTGALTSAGGFIGGTQRFIMSVEAVDYKGAPQTLTFSRDVFVNPLTGEYAFDAEIPETSTAATVTAAIGDNPSDYPTIEVDSIAVGTTDVVFSTDVPLPVRVAVGGSLNDSDGPFSGSATIRSVMRESDGTVVATTDSVVTVTNGLFSVDLEDRSTVTEIDVAWLVGVDDEPPIFRTFTELSPGDNDVFFTDVYDPPIVEITGIATRTGQPIDGDVNISLDVTLSGGSETGGGTVATDPSTGAYDFVEILRRDAASVSITVSTDDPNDGSASESIDPLRSGLNAVVIDLATTRPLLDVTGVMTIGGVAPTGNVTVAVEASDGAAQQETIEVAVDPDDVGNYAFELLLPEWATESTLTAQLGGEPLLWPTQSETGLVDGRNGITFDAVVEVQLLDVSGALTISGAAYPVPMRFYVSDAGGGSWGRFVTADVVDGRYSFTLETPATTTAVRVLARPDTGPYSAEDPQQTFTGLTPGLNELDFDVALRGRGVVIEGRLTDSSSGSTVPVTTSQTLFFFSRATPDGPSNYSSSKTITPDGDGNFSTFVIVRDDAVTLGHTTQIGPKFGDRVLQLTDGLIDGVNVVTHNDDFLPPVVNVTGTLQIDGVAVTEETTIFIPDATSGQATEVVTPDASGNFAVSLQMPRNRIGQTVEVKWSNGLAVTAADVPTVTSPVLVAGDNAVSLVSDYLRTSVTLSGVIQYRGAVPTGITNIDVFMSSTDGAGDYDLGDRNVAVTPDPDTGAYSVTFEVASASEAVNPVILLDGFRSDPYEVFSTVVDTTPGADVAATLDAQTTSVTLMGTVTTTGGDPYSDRAFTFDVSATDGGAPLDTLSDVATSTNSSGEYSVEFFLPLDTDSINVVTDLIATDPFDVVIPASPGASTVTQNLVTAGGVAVSFETFDLFGGEPTTIEIVGLRAYDDGFGPYDPEELSVDEVDLITVIDYGWVADGVVDPDTEFVEIRATYAGLNNGDDLVVKRAFDVRFATAPYALSASLGVSTHRLEWSGLTEVLNPDGSGDTFCDVEGVPFLWTATVTGYENIGSVGDGDQSNDVTLLETVVLGTGSQFEDFDGWDLIANVGDQNIGYVILEVSTIDFYDPFYIDANYGLGFEYSGGTVQQLSTYLDAACEAIPYEP